MLCMNSLFSKTETKTKEETQRYLFASATVLLAPLVSCVAFPEAMFVVQVSEEPALNVKYIRRWETRSSEMVPLLNSTSLTSLYTVVCFYVAQAGSWYSCSIVQSIIGTRCMLKKNKKTWFQSHFGSHQTVTPMLVTLFVAIIQKDRHNPSHIRHYYSW